MMYIQHYLGHYQVNRNELASSIPDYEVIRVFEWYEGIGDSYDELYSKEQESKYSLFIDTISKLISKEGRVLVLDIGCGTANFFSFVIKHIHQNNIYYIGLDLCPTLIYKGLKKCREIKGSIFDLVLGDLTQPPFKKFRVDVLLIITVIRCSYDFEAIIKGYVKYFTPKYFIFTVLCSSNITKAIVKKLNDILSVHQYNIRSYFSLRNEVLCIAEKLFWKGKIRS